jgi:tyrosinase
MQRATPGNFSKFQHALEWMHDHFHNFIGGDLAGTCPRELREVMGGDCSHGFTSNGK